MKNSGKFQNSMRAVTINSEFSLPGLISFSSAARINFSGEHFITLLLLCRDRTLKLVSGRLRNLHSR